jgi:hypothetical protein
MLPIAATLVRRAMERQFEEEHHPRAPRLERAPAPREGRARPAVSPRKARSAPCL